MAHVGSTVSFFGTKLSYAAGLGFMRNMQVVIGNKVSRLPLGWFRADSAGKAFAHGHAGDDARPGRPLLFMLASL